MPLRLTHIAKRVRDDSLGSVAREAVLRVSKKVRLSRFQAEIERTPEVSYCPIGYYKPALQAISAEAREAIVPLRILCCAENFPCWVTETLLWDFRRIGAKIGFRARIGLSFRQSRWPLCGMMAPT